VTHRTWLIAAAILAVCFVLPLSTCTRYVDANGDSVEVAEGAPPPAGARAIVDRQTAAEQLVTNPLGGVSMLVAFVGPLASALWLRRDAGTAARRVLFWIQPLLLAFAGHSVYVIGGFGETTAAAWLAAAAIAALALTWLLALVRPAPIAALG
jgi:hypothetical protein